MEHITILNNKSGGKRTDMSSNKHHKYNSTTRDFNSGRNEGSRRLTSSIDSLRRSNLGLIDILQYVEASM